VPCRHDPRDVLVCQSAKCIRDLPYGARVGTGSPRRRAQLLALRPDLQILGVRGNVDTRLRSFRSGMYDAIVLADAGLRRSGLYDDRFMSPLDVDEMVPSAGQGALALQCRRGDLRTRTLLSVLDDRNTALCVALERLVVASLDGDCQSPIGAYASIVNDMIVLRTAVGARGGEPPVNTAEASGGVRDAGHLVEDVLASLRDRRAVVTMPEGMAREVEHAGSVR
jgi:hydroxymethylbilane synthase